MTTRKIYILLYALLGAAYLGGLLLQIMDIDAAQYASMSMEMLKSKSFVALYDGKVPYLDKPPLLLWLSTLSFSLLGISDFAYRLPSFLASILAVYSTYCLARQWYNATIANWSALILASCQAFFLFNQDVKTDNLLTSMVIFSIWQLSSYTWTLKLQNLILGLIGIGLAMLAKGPIGLILPAVAIGADLMLKRKWKLLFNFKWLLGIPIVLIVLSPYLVGLYEQWGWHGIRFFFWTQSFGRITGESIWANEATPFFFVHSFLWSFLPWSICALFALFLSGKELIKKRFRLYEAEEGITFSGFVLIFMAFSMSHYKLPHYIFVLFPLVAVFSARWVYDLWESKDTAYKWLAIIQALIYGLLGALIISLLWLVFQPISVFILSIVIVLALTGVIISIRGKNAMYKIILPGVILMAAVNIGLNWDFYKRLLYYQSSNRVGQFITSPQHVNEAPFYYYCLHGSQSLNYYSRQVVDPIYPTGLDDTLLRHDIIVYADEAGRREIIRNGYPLVNGHDYEYLSFEEYGIQKISFQFLNPKTRPEIISRMYLLHLSKIDKPKMPGDKVR